MTEEERAESEVQVEAEAETRHDPAELVIVTGMSGAGRSTTANVLEDSGWYVIDNLPPHLLVSLADLANEAPRRADLPRLAAVVDVRTALLRLPSGLQTRHEVLDLGTDERRAAGDCSKDARAERAAEERQPHHVLGRPRDLDAAERVGAPA